MRLRLAALLLAALPAASAAGPLTGGQLEFSYGGLSPVVFVGDGTSAGTALSSAHVELAPGSAFADVRTFWVPAPPISGALLTIGANQGGAFLGMSLADPSATFAARLRLEALGIWLFDFTLPIGGSGSQQVTTASGVTLLKENFPWTSGALTVTGIGGTSKTVTATGSVQTGTPGLVSLVAAMKLNSNLAAPVDIAYRLTLHFESVPEPAAWLLLAAGALALTGARQTRRRR